MISLYTLTTLGYAAWLVFRMITRLPEDSWMFQLIAVLLLVDMSLDAYLDMLLEHQRVSKKVHIMIVSVNFAFFSSLRLYLDSDVCIGTINTYFAIVAVILLFLFAVFYFCLPEKDEGRIRLPL